MTEEQGQRKRQKISKEALEQAINAKKSYWPFALAVALSLMLVGVIVNPIVFWIGLALVIGAIIGWGLEFH